jgi:hypothetical protein
LVGWIGHYYIWVCCQPRSAVSYQRRVYGKSASIKEQHENEETKRLMIGNILELQEAARREVMVGEVETPAPEFLAAVPFAIHVAMQ